MPLRMDSHGSLRLRGSPAVYGVPADGDPHDPAQRRLLVAGQNTICYGMYDAVQRFLLRDFDAWAPANLVLGFGGDYDQPEDPVTTPPTDQGTRIGPAHSDAYMRKPFYAGPIQQVRVGTPTTDRRVVYVAVVAPDYGVTDEDDVDRPYLNELGITARNGTLLAHYIPESGVVDGRAERYAKSSAMWLVVEWTVEFVGDES